MSLISCSNKEPEGNLAVSVTEYVCNLAVDVNEKREGPLKLI